MMSLYSPVQTLYKQTERQAKQIYSILFYSEYIYMPKYHLVKYKNLKKVRIAKIYIPWCVKKERDTNTNVTKQTEIVWSARKKRDFP